MSKQYGLILPGQQKKTAAPTKELQRPSIFNEDSSSDSDGNAPPLLKPKTVSTQGPGTMERRLARKVQEKALEEDPTVFQYDELYDEMENKREVQKQTKAMEPKKSKYITRLLETAERRKLENELRIERQVQKEREAEGDEFKEKEAFVTSAYRKKLEEMRKMEEKDKREEYLEAVGDVTKQKDLDGFYRHLYEQKLGAPKKEPVATAAGDDVINYKPIRSGKPTQQRAYRKRQSSDDEFEAEKDAGEQTEVKKVHLPNNIDADSDFSIDSSSSDDEEQATKVVKTDEKVLKQIDSTLKESEKTVSGVGNSNSNSNIEIKSKYEQEKDCSPLKEERPEVRTINKKDIWKKRTIGEVFQSAVQRYYERKAARNA